MLHVTIIMERRTLHTVHASGVATVLVLPKRSLYPRLLYNNDAIMQGMVDICQTYRCVSCGRKSNAPAGIEVSWFSSSELLTEKKT